MKYLQFANGRITLATNCDMFVFMNGELVVDLGGVHGPQSATLKLGTVRLRFDALLALAAGMLNLYAVHDTGCGGTCGSSFACCDDRNAAST